VYLQIIADALLIACILWTKLSKAYPFFLAYVLTDCVQQVLQAVYSGNLEAEQYLYMVGNAPKLVLITFTIREVLQAAFESYSGLAEFSKRASGYLATASALVALALAKLDPSVPWLHRHLLQHFFTFERTVDFTLLIYLLIISVFMAWFPVRIRRNVAIFIGGFVAYFASECAGLFLVNRALRAAQGLHSMMLAVSLGCVVSWIMAIRPRTQEAMAVTGIRWNPAALAKLSRQLESINASLARFIRTKRK
jgi:hypothetical protein